MPMSAQDVEVFIRRIEPWTFRRQSKLAAIYVKRADLLQYDESDEVEIEGNFYKILPSKSLNLNVDFKNLAFSAFFLAVILVTNAASYYLVSERRSEIEKKLTEVERLQAKKLRHMDQLNRARLEADFIADANLRPGGFNLALSGLKVASRDRVESAIVQSYHWRDGVWVVESVGPNPPIQSTDFNLVRSAASVRKGVWAWGVDQG